MGNRLTRQKKLPAPPKMEQPPLPLEKQLDFKLPQPKSQMIGDVHKNPFLANEESEHTVEILLGIVESYILSESTINKAKSKFKILEKEWRLLKKTNEKSKPKLLTEAQVQSVAREIFTEFEDRMKKAGSQMFTEFDQQTKDAISHLQQRLRNNLNVNFMAFGTESSSDNLEESLHGIKIIEKGKTTDHRIDIEERKEGDFNGKGPRNNDEDSPF